MKISFWAALGFIATAIFSTRVSAQIYAGNYMIIEEANTVTIFAYLGSETNVVVPSSINNKPVTHIGFNSFQSTSVESVSLPGTIVSIGSAAFYDCKKLASITIPNSVTEVGDQAFWGCVNLQSVTMGSGVKSIGGGAFEFCTKLESIVIPDGVEFLGSSSFWGCTSLKTISIGNGVPDILPQTFYGCKSLQTVAVGEKVSSIGAFAFDGCSSLKTLALPASVTFLDDGAFRYCTALLSLKFFGNAPAQGDTEEGDYSVLYGDYQTTVYYLDGMTGWSSTFSDRPTAKWSGGANVLPAFTNRTPTADPSANEGASLSFSVTASDSSDPETSERGMVSVTWFVNGTQVLETKTGAPNAISSAYTLRTDASTIVGASSGQIAVKAVALDKQGGTAETSWTAQITNVLGTQKITFAALPSAASGDADFSPGATASSGLAVAYASSNEAVATIVDGKIHVVAPGTSVITASQSGNSDYNAATSVKQTLTVKTRVSATIASGNGTITGAGLYAPGSTVTLTAKPATGYSFLSWSDGVQTASRKISLASGNVDLGASFGLTSQIAAPQISDPGDQNAMTGLAYSYALDIASDSLATVTVSGLPGGMKYDAATKTISGIPTKAGTQYITVTAKNASAQTSVLKIKITVAALPVWASGTFAGWVFSSDYGKGLASLTVSTQGKIAGKVILPTGTYSFSAASFGSLSDDGVFSVALTATAPKLAPLPLVLTIDGPPEGDLPAGLGKAEITLEDAEFAHLFRNIWKDAGAAELLAPFVGYYTATLPCDSGDAGSGYLAFTADQTGGVKTAGKLADGTAASFSGTLLMDWDARFFTVCSAVPKTYAGGSFFGLAEFAPNDGGAVCLSSYTGEMFSWTNNNPLATLETCGFERDVDIVGGWYDKLINLRSYYENGLAVTGVTIPSGIIASVRYTDYNWDSESENPPKISWTEQEEIFDVGVSPEGTVLSVTPATGIGTGLVAPKAGTPIKYSDPDSGTWYDYDVDNAAALTTSFARATGLFRGTFKVYFDYISASDWTSGKDTQTHVVKSVSYEGALTPVTLSGSEDAAGRGFFLWPGKGEYENAAGNTVSYTFNYSNDFLLIPADPFE